MLEATEEWEGNQVSATSVTFVNGLAESSDGIHWTKVKAPILAVRGPHNSVGNGHERRGTLRCPIPIGSLWTGFATGIGGGWAPAAALTLDEWVALGVSSMPSKQDYEEGMVHPPWMHRGARRIVLHLPYDRKRHTAAFNYPQVRKRKISEAAEKCLYIVNLSWCKAWDGTQTKD